MKHAFNIYPALFNLTPVMQEESIRVIDEGSEKDYHFDEDYTPIMFRCIVDLDNCLLLELLDERLVQLKPIKIRGSRYTITYVPVSN